MIRSSLAVATPAVGRYLAAPVRYASGRARPVQKRKVNQGGQRLSRLVAAKDTLTLEQIGARAGARSGPSWPVGDDVGGRGL